MTSHKSDLGQNNVDEPTEPERGVECNIEMIDLSCDAEEGKAKSTEWFAEKSVGKRSHSYGDFEDKAKCSSIGVYKYESDASCEGEDEKKHSMPIVDVEEEDFVFVGGLGGLGDTDATVHSYAPLFLPT
jgi:hypothetical protein